MRSLMWFRSDLRVADNPALASAAARATRGVVGVFLVAADQWAEHDWGDAKVDFVLRNLEALSEKLRKLRIPLLVRTCERFEDAPDELLALARRHSCDELHFNHEYEVNEAVRDQAVTSRFWG